MNKGEIIKGLESVKKECGIHLDESFAWICEPIDRAIELIEKEPCCDCIEFKRYAKEIGFEIEQEPILDKIRAEIEQAADKQFQIAMGVADLNKRYTHIQTENAYRHSLNIIDKYKVESED